MVNPKWQGLSAWNHVTEYDAAELAKNLEGMDPHDGTSGRKSGFRIEEDDLIDLERILDTMAANKQRNFGERQAAANEAYEAAVILRRVRDGYSR